MEESAITDKSIPEKEKLNGDVEKACQGDGLEKFRFLSGISLITVIANLVILATTAGIIAFTLKSGTHPPPLPVTDVCVNCETLSNIIGKWAWKGVDVSAESGKCCFRSDTGLSETLQYYIETRLSSNKRDFESDFGRIETSVELLKSLVLDRLPERADDNSTSVPYHILESRRWTHFIDKFINQRRSVLHLTSLTTSQNHAADPSIIWESEVKQGNISLTNDNSSVSITRSGLYFISTQVKFRASLHNNQTRNTTLQFYLATLREGNLSHVDDYKKRVLFHVHNNEHESTLNTVTKLQAGDTFVLRFPLSQKLYLASQPRAHRISIFEIT